MATIVGYSAQTGKTYIIHDVQATKENAWHKLLAHYLVSEGDLAAEEEHTISYQELADDFEVGELYVVAVFAEDVTPLP